MYCSNCGMEIEDDSLYCTTCGEKVTDILNEMGIRYKNGDESAFREIYEDTVSWVRSYVYNRVSRDNVEDCMQQIYIKLYQNIGYFDESKGHFRTWFNTLIKNETIDFLRKYEKPQNKNVDSLYDDEDKIIDFVDPGMTPEDVMEKQEIANIMSEILSEISEEQRQCIMLHYMEGLKNKEIAEIYGISEGTVKSRISYGLKKIEAKVIIMEKQGTKLYSMSPLAFFAWMVCRGNVASLAAGGSLWENISVATTVGASVTAIEGGVVRATTIGGSAAGVTAVGATTAGVVTAGVKAVLLKIAIGIAVSGAIIAGGMGIKQAVEKNKAGSETHEITVTDVATEDITIVDTTEVTVDDNVGDGIDNYDEDIEDFGWIDAYIDAIKVQIQNGNNFGSDVKLCDMDEDGIPEMFLGDGYYENYLYTYCNGEVECKDVSRHSNIYLGDGKGIREMKRQVCDQPCSFTVFKKEGNTIIDEYTVTFGVGYETGVEVYTKNDVSITYDEAVELLRDYIDITSYEIEESQVGEDVYFIVNMTYEVNEGFIESDCIYSIDCTVTSINEEEVRKCMEEYYQNRNGLSTEYTEWGETYVETLHSIVRDTDSSISIALFDMDGDGIPEMDVRGLSVYAYDIENGVPLEVGITMSSPEGCLENPANESGLCNVILYDELTRTVLEIYPTTQKGDSYIFVICEKDEYIKETCLILAAEGVFEEQPVVMMEVEGVSKKITCEEAELLLSAYLDIESCSLIEIQDENGSTYTAFDLAYSLNDNITVIGYEEFDVVNGQFDEEAVREYINNYNVNSTN